MTQYSVHLDGIHEVRAFHAVCLDQPYDVDLRADRYCIDAKSLLGIFSLDLCQPVLLVAHTNDNDAVKTAFGAFLAP